MYDLFSSPFFGIFLCLASYSFGGWLYKKTKWIILNPFLVATVICIAFLQVSSATLAQFQIGASVVQLFLAPATCVIALSIYRQRKVLGKYFFPIVAGCSVSAVVSILLSLVLGRLFGLDANIIASTVPSSVTTPIAIEVASSGGGLVSIAILCVVITGVAGAIFAPLFIKLCRLSDPVEIGVAIGASSHVMGTTKALEIGEVEGAMSGVAIGIAGLATVFLTLFM